MIIVALLGVATIVLFVHVVLRLLEFFLLRDAFTGRGVLRVRLQETQDARRGSSHSGVDDDNSADSDAPNETSAAAPPASSASNSSRSTSSNNGFSVASLLQLFEGRDAVTTPLATADVELADGARFYGSLVRTESDAEQQQHRQSQFLPIVFSHCTEHSLAPLDSFWSLPSSRCNALVKVLLCLAVYFCNIYIQTHVTHQQLQQKTKKPIVTDCTSID